MSKLKRYFCFLLSLIIFVPGVVSTHAETYICDNLPLNSGHVYDCNNSPYNSGYGYTCGNLPKNSGSVYTCGNP